jgi:hypothetical protein
MQQIIEKKANPSMPLGSYFFSIGFLLQSMMHDLIAKKVDFEA